MKKAYKILLAKSERKRPLVGGGGYQGIDGRIILELILDNYGVNVLSLFK
jgi:hypothetical protein